MNIKIIKADVVKSANAMGEIAGVVAKLDFAEPMEMLSGGFPGCVSAGGATSLQAEWKSDQGGWVKSAREHRQTSIDDANHIEAADDATAVAGARQRSDIMSPAVQEQLSSKLGPI